MRSRLLEQFFYLFLAVEGIFEVSSIQFALDSINRLLGDVLVLLFLVEGFLLFDLHFQGPIHVEAVVLGTVCHFALYHALNFKVGGLNVAFHFLLELCVCQHSPGDQRVCHELFQNGDQTVFVCSEEAHDVFTGPLESSLYSESLHGID